ncbi:response regulator [Sulfitobacter sp. JL08]|uniref:response regulator n=1 Tax=Sulfitobacter sp. JL08 TaxID=2070369 RepID=UPI0013B3FA9B|nr:response regulator [Sulfitobacter sp. JL08]
MRDVPLILIVDDQPDNRSILDARLSAEGYETAQAADGIEALAMARSKLPDLILLDVMMPYMDGFEVCQRIIADETISFIPVVLVTARADKQDIVKGLEAGASDYLTKPFSHPELIARVRSMLRIKALHDRVEHQKGELAEWNRALEAKVDEQVRKIERTNRLRRFLPSSVADKILAGDDAGLLASQRGNVSVLFADLRNFTSFSEKADPSCVISLLNAYHSFSGPLIEHHEGTLERFLGDGILVLFNAPLPCDSPVEKALDLAKDLQRGFQEAIAPFVPDGERVGLGIGIAFGGATLGCIGYERRYDYAAIGSVSNIASRLSDMALDGQTLISEDAINTGQFNDRVAFFSTMKLKGFDLPTRVHELSVSM